MTSIQWGKVRQVVIALGPSEAHHGDCVGADLQFHYIVEETTGIPIVVHPPIKGDKRAYVPASDRVTVLEEYDYLVRNGHIVANSDLLLAAPAGMSEIVRSGTWATVRKARSERVIVVIVFPNGEIQVELPVRRGVV